MDINLGLATLTVDPTTQADVWQAISGNSTFPDRNIKIGDISAKYSSGNITLTQGGSNVSLSASLSASSHSGIGIYTTASAAIQDLGLNPSVTPAFPADADDRFILLSFQTTAQGSVSGTAPVGVVGSVTFGAKANAATCFAVLQRFKVGTPAQTVLKNAAACVKLPSQVHTAADLAQGTWIIAEVDGSLGLSAGAQIGYAYKYTRDLPTDLQKLGLSPDLSVKVNLAAAATVTYNVSGRYLVMVGRPSKIDDQVIALQVNKGDSYGYDFGLNLSAGVQMTPIIPAKGEDLIAASFGVFGPQIVTDVNNSIAALEAWSGKGDLAQNTAALTIKSAEALLSNITGTNVIAEAVTRVKGALASWNGLVMQGSNELQTLVWDLLGKPSNTDKALIEKLLKDLQNETSFNQAISDGLQTVNGQSWLSAMANAIGAGPVLSLGSNQKSVQTIAGYALDALGDGSNGNILSALQSYISQRFGLTPLTSALNAATTPDGLDQWVRDRLAALFNQPLTLALLKKITTTINSLETKFTELYSKTSAALTKKYNFQFAASYGSTVSNATLLNLSFDLTKPGVQEVYVKVLGGNTSAIFGLDAPLDGLTITRAAMTHSIHSVATTSLTIPYLPTLTAMQQNDVTTSLSFEHNGADMVGTLDATDQDTKSNRYSSLLELAMNLGIKGGALTSISGSMAYELRVVAKGATTAQVAATTNGFVEAYLSSKFPPNAYSTRLLTDFDRAVDLPTASLGDMLISMQVAIDGDFLAAWVVPKEKLTAAQIAASKVVQQRLREYTHRAFFAKTRPEDLDGWATLPLLVWEAFPICTGIKWDYQTGTLSSTNTGNDFYLSGNENDDSLYKALINSTAPKYDNQPGLGRLHLVAAVAYQEILAAGVSKPKLVFSPTDTAASQMVSFALNNSGFTQVRALALAEATVVHGVANALKEISNAAADISLSNPSQLLVSLAEFGAILTESLNTNMTNLFTSATDMRSFGPMLFVELTRALAANSAVQAKAMLELKSLRPGHSFDNATYVTGSEPTPDQVAVSQSVVSA